jgi:hypothetical protein
VSGAETGCETATAGADAWALMGLDAIAILAPGGAGCTCEVGEEQTLHGLREYVRSSFFRPVSHSI